jgi:hypothetical protein
MYFGYIFADINWPVISAEQDGSATFSDGSKVGAHATSAIMTTKNISLIFNISSD